MLKTQLKKFLRRNLTRTRQPFKSKWRLSGHNNSVRIHFSHLMLDIVQILWFFNLSLIKTIRYWRQPEELCQDILVFLLVLSPWSEWGEIDLNESDGLDYIVIKVAASH